ncbi:MAG: P1 family peptidase [Anaerolineae bacterium]|nr:P1 family peptidase [Anaerolineae bacterium]MDW8099270.1 P1 family peptidase [Anaerolineae bacterium]
MTAYGGITDVPGIRVGHATDEQGITGCTVVLCEAGAVVGVDQRGGAPGTRETDLARPMRLVREAHAVVLAGGSAFGLAAADGVMRWLAARGVGYGVYGVRVPIVPSAILFDLAIGDPRAFPDAEMGQQACEAASDGPVEEGSVGVGTGATVGKALGMAWAMKAGVGTAAEDLGNGLIVAALVAVNALGDVIDLATGRILAGARMPDGRFADTLALMRGTPVNAAPGEATVISVVATSARLDKEGACKVAQMAQDGLARAIRPAHTMYDGDTIFTLATGAVAADVNVVGAYAAEVVARAIVRAVQLAKGRGGVPGLADLSPSDI